RILWKAFYNFHVYLLFRLGMSIDCIDYFELKGVWVKAYRNGNIRKLNAFEKGLFRACLTYTKKNGVIVNKTVLEMIGRIIEVLTTTPRREALRQGFEKVKSLVKNNLLTKIFPKILDWVTNLDYIMYLGFMEINKPEYLKVY
ncbi:MAG: hypothetical protein MRT15_08425, partial [archaeon YNP-LCB-003-016]|uniref:hypothetical protein n=1 Tax=Candidatus Culexarchaeum yellowstonense TaxID=2928963 RepID=UPI0026F0ACCB